jgi:hypothetical protein
MHTSGMTRGSRKIAQSAIAFVAFFLLLTGSCFAETAYVDQMPGNVVTTMRQDSQLQPLSTPRQIGTRTATFVLPEMSARSQHGSNSTQTLQIGSRNSVYHLQVGGNNSSVADVLGSYNNLTVLQAGNNLKSNVMLLNGSGLNVSVIQPRGSTPVNVIIARLPGGGLFIKR